MKRISARLERTGEDTFVRIPSALLERLGAHEGDLVTLTVDKGSIQIQPAAPRYTLAELLAKCDLSMPMSDEDRAWLNARPVGREIM